MENSTEELLQEGGAKTEIKEEEAELREETTNSDLKGIRHTSVPTMSSASTPESVNVNVNANAPPAATNGLSEGENEAAGEAETLQNGDRGGVAPTGTGGGEDLSSINAMMSAVMSAAGNINGEGGGGVTSASSSAGPSPR